MRPDLEGGRVTMPPGLPHWHTKGNLTCWGPKIIAVHRSRLVARLHTLALRIGS